MKISITFDSAEEFLQHIRLAQGQETELHIEQAAPEPTERPADTGTGTIVGATPEEQKQIEAEEKPVPTYTLTDAQKAVREVVKKKGKDVAKDILARFQHKDKEGPATGASALKPEDYAEAIKALEEALNG